MTDPRKPPTLGRIVRRWFRCRDCGYRVSVAGPESVDLAKYHPIRCGKCRAEKSFTLEAA